MHAYRWIMTNWTDEDIIVQIELLYSGDPYFVIVKPRKSADFNWPLGNAKAGFCCGAIKYLAVPQKPQEYTQLAFIRSFIKLNTLADGTVRNFAKQDKWLKIIHADTPKDMRTTVELRFLKDALYNQVIDQAKRIGGSTVVGWFADKIAHSKCRSRDIDIVKDEKGQIQFYTLAN